MLNLTENLPRKRKRFNPYKPLLVVFTHPLKTIYIVGWVVTAFLLGVGILLQNGAMVGIGIVLAYSLTVLGVFTAFFVFACWIEGGGWGRLRRSLRVKAENHGRIED